jgi:hypothetical protein
MGGENNMSHGEENMSHGEDNMSHGEDNMSHGEDNMSHGENNMSHGENNMSHGHLAQIILIYTCQLLQFKRLKSFKRRGDETLCAYFLLFN